MKNISLNPGGLIGAVLCLAVVIGIAVSAGGNVGGKIGGFGVIAVFAGAFGGNALWSAVFSRGRR